MRTYKNHLYESSKRHILSIRNCLLENTQSHIERYRDERDIDIAKTTLTEAQFKELVDFRIRLRDIESDSYFPSFCCLPSAPEVLGIPRYSEDKFNLTAYRDAFWNLESEVNSERCARDRALLTSEKLAATSI